MTRAPARPSILQLALFGLAVAAAAPAHAERFSFMALGDMPYVLPAGNAAFARLIARTNALRPAFTIHVGDIISGQTRCDDEHYHRVRDHFAAFDGALVYTPGDNEWTDCHRPNSGRMDPVERLSRLREVFFAEPTRSLGRMPLQVTPQSASAEFSKFVENARWTRAGVVFATLHIVGSNNNLQRDQAAVNEYLGRNAANLAWIEATFAHARETGARGVVLAFQGNLRFERETPDADQRSGYNDTLNALKRNAIAWGKPVLLVHGDFHRLLIDQPLIGPGRQRIMNVTRLMVHGEHEVHGTLVHVDTGHPDLFSYQPVFIHENIPAWKPAATP